MFAIESWVLGRRFVPPAHLVWEILSRRLRFGRDRHDSVAWKVADVSNQGPTLKRRPVVSLTFLVGLLGTKSEEVSCKVRVSETRVITSKACRSVLGSQKAGA